MEDKELNLIKTAIATIYKKYYKNYKKYKEELFAEAYVDALEKQNKLKDLDRDTRLYKYMNIASNSMGKQIYKIKRDSKNISINTKTKKSKDITLEMTLESPKPIDAGNDLTQLLNYFKSVLNEEKKEKKKIIIEYIIIQKTIEQIKKKYKVNEEEIKNTIEEFRQKYFNKLVEIEYLYPEEEAIYLCNKDFKKEEKKTTKINRLLKEKGIQVKEIAKVLKITEEEAEKKLNEENKNKFYLYDIQILRKEYFPNETLEVLASC